MVVSCIYGLKDMDVDKICDERTDRSTKVLTYIGHGQILEPYSVGINQQNISVI